MEWRLLLKRYIESKEILEQLDDYREEQTDKILSAHYSQFSHERESYISFSTENAALKLVSLDEYITKIYKRCIRRLNALNQALDTLTYEEMIAFERVAWGIDSYVPNRYEKTALKKVYQFIDDYEKTGYKKENENVNYKNQTVTSR